MKPYHDEYISENCWIRTFDPNISENDEYVWHRDKEDRTVQVLEGDGWQFQFDNELPVIINKNKIINIPKLVYHRLIPSSEKLRIKINENIQTTI